MKIGKEDLEEMVLEKMGELGESLMKNADRVPCHNHAKTKFDNNCAICGITTALNFKFHHLAATMCRLDILEDAFLKLIGERADDESNLH